MFRRRLTEADYIQHCEFIVHHGSRDERVTVNEPPYELRRNSISSAAHGDVSRRSASPMIGVMIEQHTQAVQTGIQTRDLEVRA